MDADDGRSVFVCVCVVVLGGVVHFVENGGLLYYGGIP